MLRGLNHLTLAVAELERSLAFYESLGFRQRARWPRGAYLSQGPLWLCLAVGPVTPREDYTHLAFDVAPADFEPLCARLREAGVAEWQPNASEGDSLYLLDPDGHRLELHVGDLESRLAAWRADPRRMADPGLELFEGAS